VQSTATHMFGVPPTTPSTSQNRCEGSVQIPLLHVLAGLAFVHPMDETQINANAHPPRKQLISRC